MRFQPTRAPERRARPLPARPHRRPAHHAYPSRPRPASRLATPLLALLALLAAVTLLGGAALAAQAYLASDRIVPNVAVRGLRLDGQSPGAARTALEARYAAFLRAPVAFELAGRTWNPTAVELGIRLDLDGAAAAARGYGRGLAPEDTLREIAAIWRAGIDLPLHLEVDEGRLQRYLLGLAAAVEQPPADATLALTTGQAHIGLGQLGRQFLVDETLRDAVAALQTLTPQTVPLRTRALIPRLGDGAAQATQARLDRLLTSPLTLAADEQAWTWTQAERAELLRVAPHGSDFSLAVDQERLAARVSALAPALATPPVEPRLHFNGGLLAIAAPGRDGVQLDQVRAAEQIAAALLSGAPQVALPLTALPPQARPETLAALGIVERVAQGRSSFAGSPAYRATNIAAGARLMDGVLIRPGGEFSFNQHVGDIDETNGFVLGHAIIDGRTQLEWGGGVCQVSTTVFRAAFWAGAPITERNQHSFRISWYERFEPIGMDAAIFTGPGGYDLKFVNDTAHWMLMETVFDGAAETLTVNLYGTSDGRVVEQIAPSITRRVVAPSAPRYVNDPGLPAGTLRQTDTARDGMDVSVGRVVRRGDAVLTNDSFFSRFQAWPNIFVRGTGG